MENTVSNSANSATADPRRLVAWLWCRRCADRVRLELPATTSESELDELASSFVCPRCAKGRADIAAGRVRPMAPPPAPRRDGAPGQSVAARIHGAAGKAWTR